jgi:hypothetical protein
MMLIYHENDLVGGQKLRYETLNAARIVFMNLKHRKKAEAVGDR